VTTFVVPPSKLEDAGNVREGVSTHKNVNNVGRERESGTHSQILRNRVASVTMAEQLCCSVLGRKSVGTVYALRS
jgi:hypothetical protein